MQQRSRAKLACVAICAAGALLCATNRAPLLAAVNGIAAIVVWRIRFGLPFESKDVDALIVRFRDARVNEEMSSATIRAFVSPNLIALPTSPKRWSRTTTAFRGEITREQWRQVTTALRHQSRPAVSSLSVMKMRGV